MADHEAQNSVPASAPPGTELDSRDTSMLDAAPEETISPAVTQTLSNGNLETTHETVDSPANNTLLVNGTGHTSVDGAASPLVGQDLGLSPLPQGASTPVGNDGRLQGTAVHPEATVIGASPAREYLNTKVNQHVLDGMKQLVRERPADPLKFLGEFLLQRSREMEATPGYHQ